MKNEKGIIIVEIVSKTLDHFILSLSFSSLLTFLGPYILLLSIFFLHFSSLHSHSIIFSFSFSCYLLLNHVLLTLSFLSPLLSCLIHIFSIPLPRSLPSLSFLPSPSSASLFFFLLFSSPPPSPSALSLTIPVSLFLFIFNSILHSHMHSVLQHTIKYYYTTPQHTTLHYITLYCNMIF